MDILGRFTYGIEILLAELLFLTNFSRRKHFIMHLLATITATLLCCYWSSGYRHGSEWLVFIGMLATIGVSVVGMYLVFRKPFCVILSACVSGLAVQHICHHIYRLVLLMPFVRGQFNALTELCATILGCMVAWLLLRSSLKKKVFFNETYSRNTVVVALVIVLICVGITRFVRMSGSMNRFAIGSISIYAITCCTLALYVQYSVQAFVKLQTEYLMQKRISEEERKRFEVSRENAELMNIKYHDLKHKLMALKGQLPEQEIESMQALIDRYDGIYYTGLDVLDIILNEKNMRCQAKGITMTAMGNGAELAFMDNMDVYSLFGNVLDNAIEAVMALEPPGRRTISLIIERRGEFVYINCVNFLDHDLLLQDNGLPDTTKTTEFGYHGYGLRSVRMIAEKYHGGISINAQDGVFGLSIYMSGIEGN